MLKNLLSGGSLFGVANAPSPYAVRKETQLPVFGNSDGAITEAKGNGASENNPSLFPSASASAPERDAESAAYMKLPGSAKAQSLVTSAATGGGEIDFEKRVRMGPERRSVQVEPEERRRLLDRNRRNTPRKLTQEEMRLEQVTVVRNDLRDSDLELAPRRRAERPEGDLNPFAPRPIGALGRPTHEKISFGARVARWFRFLKRR